MVPETKHRRAVRFQHIVNDMKSCNPMMVEYSLLQRQILQIIIDRAVAPKLYKTVKYVFKT